MIFYQSWQTSIIQNLDMLLTTLATTSVSLIWDCCILPFRDHPLINQTKALDEPFEPFEGVTTDKDNLSAILPLP